MHSFLGVPIRVRSEVFGNLYLTEKRGDAEFDPEDEAVLSTLAVAAGIAIENARYVEMVRMRERWLTANTDITRALLSGVPQDEVLEGMLERAQGITDADIGVCYLLGPEGDLRGSLALGDGAATHRGLVLPSTRGTLAEAVLAHDGLVTVDDLENDERVAVQPERWAGFGPAVAVTVGTRAKLNGILILARRRGRAPFTPAEIAALPGFADQAALALELAERRRDAEQVSLLEDHDRIARDLHDLAIQRLFATGMTLQSAQRFVDHPEAAERLTRAVEELDTTIKIIRSTIFGLRMHKEPNADRRLRMRAVEAVGEATAALGFAPALHMEGLIDIDTTADISDDIVAVIGEALSNVSRHSRATRAEVAIKATGDELTVTVTDNGTGLPAAGHRSGLRNLAERADRLGGRLRVTSSGSPPRGTRLEWRIPIVRRAQRT